MKRLLLISALLGIGCDDPGAADVATSVLVHGAASAHITCSGTFNGTGSGSYRATKMQDGSCLASGAYLLSYPSGAAFSRAATQFSPRGESGADVCAVEIPDSFTMSADDGDWKFTGFGAAKAIAIFCTGFNLEAFGVSP